jgi:hypothetical protein
MSVWRGNALRPWRGSEDPRIGDLLSPLVLRRCLHD